MDAVLSVPGTFHFFSLGEQLHRRNGLSKLYTRYPRFNHPDHSIPRSKVQPIRHPELISQGLARVPFVDRVITENRAATQLFDRSVARNLSRTGGDLFVAFPGSALQSVRRANELGMTTILEASSSHARTQARILAREYRRHGHEPPVDERSIGRKETVYDEADIIMTPSKFVYESFLEHGIRESKLKLEPYAVDPDKYTPGDGQPNPVRFTFAGRVDFRKGIEYLLEAWDGIDLQDAELVLAGKVFPEAKDLQARYSSNQSVKFLGWTDDVVSLYQRSSVFVFPTLEEGSAYVTYEAMASGLPLVTTRRSGWVGDDGEHGIEVEPRDVEGLRSAICSLYENAQRRRKMGQRARKRILSNYTWDQYGSRVYDQYESFA